MKPTVRFFRERREARLRKWCVEQAARAGVPGREFAHTVEFLYGWGTGRAN